MAGDPGLFGDQAPAEGPEEDAPSDLFAAAAEAGARRGIGRPKGALNRKTEAFEKWFMARYKDPGVFLGELMTMDARSLRALAHELDGENGPTLLEVIKLQIAAAAELMPYLHGKVPQQVQVLLEQLPMLVIRGDLDQVQQVRKLEADKALSVGAPLVEGEASKIKDLEGGE